MSLRKYVTDDEVRAILNDELLILNDALISEAEANVDSIIATHNTGSFMKAYNMTRVMTVNWVNNTTLAATESISANEFTYCVVRFLSGAGAGHKTAIVSNTTTEITIESVGNHTGAALVHVEQLGKAPFDGDSIVKDNVVYKIINEDIKRAVAYQIEYMLQPLTAANRKGTKVKSENIGSSYSYTLDDISTILSNKVDIAPKTLDILAKYATHVLV